MLNYPDQDTRSLNSMSCLAFVSRNRCPGKFPENQPQFPDSAKPKKYTCQHSMGKQRRSNFSNAEESLLGVHG